MTVAVLMSTYNGEQYIREQIESILAQRGDFVLDLWVRDDGSKDGTTRILEEYAGQGKLHWYCGENLRSAHSFMDLFLHCPGYDYYAFADQDDIWFPDRISSGMKAMRATSEPALSFSNAHIVDAKLNYLNRDVYRVQPAMDFPTLSCAGGILGCTILFNRALAEVLRQGGMPGEIVMHDFYVSLVCVLAGGTIYYNPDPQIQYRQHGNNVVGISGNKTAALKNRMELITKRANVTVAQQARTVAAAFPNLGSEENRRWLNLLVKYDYPCRMRIALSGKTRYATRNVGITIRFAILLGNR